MFFLTKFGYRYFIEDEYKKSNHFIKLNSSNNKISLNQDMQLNIWARRIIL